MNAERRPTADVTTTVHRTRRLRLWFAAGYLVVFVGMLFLVHIIAIHTSGRYATEYPLWRYYADGLSRLFGTSTLGPASTGALPLVETALLHVLLSTLGGGAAAVVGWSVLKLRSRNTAESDATPSRRCIA